jgi:uncharacterized protein
MSAPVLTLVLDTNVYISAALRGEISERILQLAAAGRIRIIASSAIMDELAQKMGSRFGWSTRQIDLLLDILGSAIEVIEPDVHLDVVKEDRDDNRILECAVTGKADLIVSFDRDLLRLRKYASVGIIRPEELFYYSLGEASPKRKKPRRQR